MQFRAIGQGTAPQAAIARQPEAYACGRVRVYGLSAPPAHGDSAKRPSQKGDRLL